MLLLDFYLPLSPTIEGICRMCVKKNVQQHVGSNTTKLDGPEVVCFIFGNTKKMVSKQLTVIRFSVSSAAKALRTHIHMHSLRRESISGGLKQLNEDITSAVRPTLLEKKRRTGLTQCSLTPLPSRCLGFT